MIIVGVDVGGTTIRATAYNGRASRFSSTATVGRGGAAIAEQIADMVSMAVLDERPAAIGVGIPGQVEFRTGMVRHAVNLGIDGLAYPLAADLAGRFAVPVVVENDVRAAAVGAFRFFRPSRPGVRDLVYIGIGTGISAGVIIDGRLHRGRHGVAGEIGHLAVTSNGPPCRCGLTGCLEAVAAGPALAGRWHDDTGALFRAADGGDARAAAVARELAGYLARAIHGLSAAYDPDVVVLGGGVGSSGPGLARHIGDAIDEIVERSPFAGVLLDRNRVLAVPPDASVGTLGAAKLARRALESSGYPEQRSPATRLESTREEGTR